MKQALIPTLATASMLVLLSGCVIELGTGSRTVVQKPTIGQQLLDLQKAKDSGAITDSEFEAQKAKLLENK
jgi:hypothetical protein